MIYAKSYRGNIPIELYIKLQNTFPQAEGEADAIWLQRVKKHPLLAQRMFGTKEFKTELIQAVHRRAMAHAGARRVGHQKPGPALVPLKGPGTAQAKASIAARYQKEFLKEDGQSKYAKEAYQMLLEQFDAATPPGGSIFWNGINELALAKLVDRWNTELGGEVFGQLEATTAARYVNKRFEWDQGGVFQQYFTEVSDKLGHAARGHVTSVVRCGMRHDSIFTVTELPRMFKAMEDQIKAKQTPTVTDITVVVIQPKHLEDRPVKSFTNNELSMVPIIRPTGRFINSRADCTVDGNLQISPRIREFWHLRGQIRESEAARRIENDFQNLIRWG